MTLSNSDSSLPLFVDLDGTVIKSDITFEAVLLLLQKNVFYLALLPVWLCRGLAYLKEQLARRVQVPVDKLPLNEEFMDYLRGEKAAGRPLILISASHHSQVRRVGEQLGLFAQIEGTDLSTNLKARHKLKKIQQLCGDKKFAYAGNARADLPIWSAASQAILVNCSDQLKQQLDSPPDTLLHFDRASSRAGKLLDAMRPHQWLKNGLVFLPLILSHQLGDLSLLGLALIAFVSFSLCASSVYLLNDMLDLASDRDHHSKCRRPFASGDLPLPLGFVAMPVLLLAAFVLALALPGMFALVLLAYWLLTSFYSLFLKRLFLVDVLTLALLYTLRIFAGAAAISVVVTGWLIAFSLSLFLGLAIIKRVTELSNLRGADTDGPAGRGYQTDHRRLLMVIGGLACVAAVVVFAFYINDPETLLLYDTPVILWFICPLLVILLVRIWRKARSGDLHEDPVLFAVTDHISQAIVLVSGALIWLAI